MKKYAIRAVKYFIFICALVAIVILFMVTAGFVQGSINDIFRNGYNAIWQIALIFAVIAAVYPRVGFTTRKISFSGTWEEAKDMIQETMQSRRYKLTSENGNVLSYSLENIIAKIPKFFADEITLTRIDDPEETDSEKCVAEVEGPTKDVLRILAVLSRIRHQSNGQ